MLTANDITKRVKDACITVARLGRFRASLATLENGCNTI